MTFSTWTTWRCVELVAFMFFDFVVLLENKNDKWNKKRSSLLFKRGGIFLESFMSLISTAEQLSSIEPEVAFNWVPALQLRPIWLLCPRHCVFSPLRGNSETVFHQFFRGFILFSAVARWIWRAICAPTVFCRALRRFHCSLFWAIQCWQRKTCSNNNKKVQPRVFVWFNESSYQWTAESMCWPVASHRVFSAPFRFPCTGRFSWSANCKMCFKSLSALTFT